MQNFRIILFVLCFILYNAAYSISSDEKLKSQTVHYTYKIINVFPHDPNAWTQGLVFEKGILYESTGRNGCSYICKKELKTGKVLQIKYLDKKFYGEGISIFKDQLVQLTWHSKIAFVYDKNDFSLIKKFSYPTRGWGITFDGSHLIMSDGSASLYFLSTQNFKCVKNIIVKDNQTPIKMLNELEYINGRIFANIWKSDLIAVILPETGRVDAWINLKGLMPLNQKYQNSLLNGIAYDIEKNRLFVTGKLWQKLFEIQLIPLKK